MKLICLLNVMNLSGLSKTSIYKLMQDGRFPKNIKIGSRTSRWIESEVVEWVESRKLERLVLCYSESRRLNSILTNVFN
ncbi:TPA: AlpA family transcriptional regulator [Vibrio parahaemolyticus]|nr:AlpA family transcriptional regulator [Vibrio parahaemolyticus]HCE4618628.1 AlpA family transcriptional regulator [Vibrio parahaemolyticus]HCE4621722.1 AlpA family transcriptional regulator [Vibrio parahaemolyticus]